MQVNPIFSSFELQEGQSMKNKVDDATFKSKLEEAQQTKDEKKLKDACRQFESIFITMLLKNMRNTIPEGGYLQKSYPRQVFESMMDEKIAEEITKDHGMGLGQQLYKQLAKTVLKG